jgi:hypothetical protein
MRHEILHAIDPSLVSLRQILKVFPSQCWLDMSPNVMMALRKHVSERHKLHDQLMRNSAHHCHRDKALHMDFAIYENKYVQMLVHPLLRRMKKPKLFNSLWRCVPMIMFIIP